MSTLHITKDRYFSQDEEPTINEGPLESNEMNISCFYGIPLSFFPFLQYFYKNMNQGNIKIPIRKGLTPQKILLSSKDLPSIPPFTKWIPKRIWTRESYLQGCKSGQCEDAMLHAKMQELHLVLLAFWSIYTFYAFYYNSCTSLELYCCWVTQHVLYSFVSFIKCLAPHTRFLLSWKNKILNPFHLLLL